MEFILCCILLTLVNAESADKVNKSENGQNQFDITAFEDEFSPETFNYLNSSKKEKKFNLRSLESMTRRWDLYWYNAYAVKHVYTHNLNMRTCWFLYITVASASQDIRRYYHLRYLYVDNLDYEMGYITYKIVRLYQMMIEIYQIMLFKFYIQPDAWAAPTSYIFYMYRNTLELGMSITHLCNMMHELEAKYFGHPLGPWDDYPMSEDETGKKKRTATAKVGQAVVDYQKRRQEEYKRRLRQRRKERKGINFDTKITTPYRRPKKSFWPLHYGWSIEFW